MSCDEDSLAAFARGTLAGAPLRAARAHLASCATCRDELDWLVRERRAIALAVASDAPLPDVETVLARVAPLSPRPRSTWLPGVLALGLAPAAALLTILTVGSTLPPSAIAGELAAVDPAPACFPGGDGEEGDVGRLEAMFAACLVASPGPSRSDDRSVTEALYSPHGREACE